MKECLEGLVGLSRLDCDCFTVDESLKESKLNLFLDELEAIDLELIQNALGCGEVLNTLFNKIYGNAVNFFESDLQVAIAENYKQKYKPFVGKIGETKYNAGINTSALVGIKLDTKYIEGASIILNSINLYFDSVGSIDLQIYKNTELITTETIAITGSVTSHTLATPLQLPIMENGIKNDYYFVYEPLGMQPMNNKVSCGCAGVEQVRGKFITPKGVKGTTIDDLSLDGYAYGLSLNVSISCAIDNMLCDFMLDDTFYRRAGMALWYKMGVLTIEEVFASRNINYDTFTDREYLYTRKKKFESNYKNIILWLAENTTINNSDCFVCNTKNTLSMGKILI